MLTIAVGATGLLFVNHPRQGTTEYLEEDLHYLFAYVFAFTVTVLILEWAVVDESLVIIALLRCTCFVWLGVWEIHIAFTLYSDNKTPRTDNILLTPDPMQKMLDLLTCIGYMVMSMVIVASQSLAVYLFLKLLTKKKTQHNL